MLYKAADLASNRLVSLFIENVPIESKFLIHSQHCLLNYSYLQMFLSLRRRLLTFYPRP